MPGFADRAERVVRREPGPAGGRRGLRPSRLLPPPGLCLAGPCVRARPQSDGGGAIGPPSSCPSLACPPSGPGPAFPLPAFLQSSFSLGPALGWQTKSLSEATGGRRLIKMHLFALRPGCHLRAALSSQTAKRNSCAAHTETLPGESVPRGAETPSCPAPSHPLCPRNPVAGCADLCEGCGVSGGPSFRHQLGSRCPGTPETWSSLLVTAGQPRAVGLTGS